MKNLNTMFGKVHPKIKTWLKLINLQILMFIIRKKGAVSYKEIEQYTGLHNVSAHLITDLIKHMVKAKILTLKNGHIIGDIKQLTEIIEQDKTVLPMNHNKLWSEKELVVLSELKIEGQPISVIRQKLKRTENAIEFQCTMLRKAYKLIPIIERNAIVRDFASQMVSPNTADNI